jgi:hypothetical protein
MKWMWPVLATACAGPRELVILAEAWEPVHETADALADEMPPDVRRCGEGALVVEPEGFEISTDTCSWATVGQPITTVLRPGDVLDVGATHLDLWAPGEAEAVIAIGIEEVELVRWVRPIPSTATVLYDQIVLEDRFSAGETLWFHVHNHGANSYRPTRIALQ